MQALGTSRISGPVFRKLVHSVEERSRTVELSQSQQSAYVAYRARMDGI